MHTSWSRFCTKIFVVECEIYSQGGRDKRYLSLIPLGYAVEFEI